MVSEDVTTLIGPDRLKEWLQTAFKEAGITSKEFPKDDSRVEEAAHIAYKKIPLLPFRVAIKAAIGESGFTKLVFS
jgi:hypothetical protein